MKKILTILGALLVLASCDSYFDVNLQDQATLEEMFSRKNTTRNYLAHLYNYMPRDERPNNYEGGVVCRSDEALFGSSSYATIWYNFRTGDYSASTPVSEATGNYWKKFYIAINQCTIFINNVDLDKEDDALLRECMKAEARFLRAYYYFCLFRQYGPVFIWMDENGDPIAPDEAIEGEKVDRHTVDQNIDFIVRELDRASEALPLAYSNEEVGVDPTANVGRVTKGAALALKSRVLLYAASPLYNGQSGYDGSQPSSLAAPYRAMTNLYGDQIFPAYDASKWQRAKEAAKAVIDMNRYKLVRSTESGDKFLDAMASYENIFFEKWNSETIWGWWWRNWDTSGDNWLGTVGGYLATCVPRRLCYQGYQLMTPSLKLVDSYAMAESGRYPLQLGNEYDHDTQGLDYSKPHVDSQSGYAADGWVENYIQPMDYNLYQNKEYPSWAKPIKVHASTVGREARYYACLVPNGFWWPSKSGGVSDAGSAFTNGSLFTCYNNEQEATSFWMQTGEVNRVGYSWRRLYKAGNPLSVATDYTSIRYVFPAFRLAEIYLNYAEACNETGDEAEALKYLNEVRDRAGLNKIEEAYPEVRGNKQLLRLCIQKEKMIEFAFEAQRHYDACRWMIAKDEYNCNNWTLHVKDETYEGSYARVKDDYMGNPAVFRDRDYLFPISSNQLAEMTNLTQNYGY